jgi:hypothetical protein
MPHLHFDLNFVPSGDAKTRFAAAVVQHFARVMDTGTDHDGPDFQMHDGVLPSWSAGEDPLEGLH